MGKKSSLKKQRKSQPVQIGASNPPAMDPVLIEAYVRGRTVGIKEGKVDGIAEIMTLFDQWIDEIDIKGIGPQRKLEIQMYFASRIQESINKNKNGLTGKM